MTRASERRPARARAMGAGASVLLSLVAPAVSHAADTPGPIRSRDPAAWLLEPSTPVAAPTATALAVAGFAAISAGDKRLAAEKLAAALGTGEAPPDQARNLRLALSDVLAQLGRPGESAAQLAPLAGEQSYDVQARRAFALDASGQRAEAAQAFAAAMAVAPNPEARLLMAKGRIYALLALDRRGEVMVDVAALARVETLPGKDAIELAYIAIRYGDDALAERLFDQAERQRQLAGPAAIDAGYTAQRAHHDARALAYFRTGLATSPPPATPADAQARFQLEREVADMSRSWGAYASMLYDNTSSIAASLPGSSRGNVQTGFEAYYRPLGYNAGRPIELFVRAFETLSSRRGDPTGGDTVQGWAGVRVKPFAAANLVLEASRMFKVGSVARDDWMLRAGYSATDGLDLRQDRASWPLRHVYIDVAQLLDAGETFASLEGRVGQSFKLGGQGRTIVAPFIGLSVAYDSGQANPTAVGIGPGVWLRPWFRGDDQTAAQSYIDLVLQYRARVGGDRRAEGFLATLSVSY
jgi:hypothetical protein